MGRRFRSVDQRRRGARVAVAAALTGLLACSGGDDIQFTSGPRVPPQFIPQLIGQYDIENLDDGAAPQAMLDSFNGWLIVDNGRQVIVTTETRIQILENGIFTLLFVTVEDDGVADVTEFKTQLNGLYQLQGSNTVVMQLDDQSDYVIENATIEFDVNGTVLGLDLEIQDINEDLMYTVNFDRQ